MSHPTIGQIPETISYYKFPFYNFKMTHLHHYPRDAMLRFASRLGLTLRIAWSLSNN